MVVTAMVTFQDARKWVCAGSAVCRLPWESALCAPGRDGPLWPGGSEAALSWSAEERGLWSHSRCCKHLKVRPYLEHVQKRSFYASVCTCSPAPHVSGPLSLLRRSASCLGSALLDSAALVSHPHCSWPHQSEDVLPPQCLRQRQGGRPGSPRPPPCVLRLTPG